MLGDLGARLAELRQSWAFFRRLHGKAIWHITAVTLLGLVTTVGFMAVLLPLLQAAGVTGGAGSPSLTLNQALGLFLGAAVAQAGWVRYQGIASVRFREETVRKLVRSTSQLVEKAQWEWVARHRASGLVQAFQVDIERAASVAQTLVSFACQGVMAVAYLAVSVAVAGSAVLLLPALGSLFLAAVGRRLGKARRQGGSFEAAYREQAHYLESFLAGFKTFRSHGEESLFIERLGAASDRRADISLDTVRAEANQGFTARIVGLLVLAGVLAWAIPNASVSVGELLVLLYALSRLAPATQLLASLATHLFFNLSAVQSLEQLQQDLREHQISAEDGGPFLVGPGAEIMLRDVHYVYPGGRGVYSIDFDLPGGTWTCLCGSSGAGKSTVADLVLGLLRPDKGTITVGEELFRVDKGRRQVAYVPQQAFFYGATLRENLCLSLQGVNDETIWRTLSLVGLETRCRGMEGGLDASLDDLGQNFSVGERQRLGLVRALLRDPVLLVLDEPTANLDRESERQVVDALLKVKADMITLVVSHQPVWQELADQVLALENGRLKV